MSENDELMNQDRSTPKWLKTIQLNSWEAELLISALVLYALFQVPDYIEKLSLQTFERGSFAISFSRMVKSAFDLLKYGYVLHIIVRGVWVSSVGLSYVFPKGIQHETLKFKGKFKKELVKSNSLVKSVLRLEELSSLIYGISFIGFGSLTGVATLLFSLVLLSQLFASDYLANSPYLSMLFGAFFFMFFLLAIVVFIDFLTSGFFRRKSWTVDWFYPVALIFRIVTLSFLYRRSILVLQSNTKGWKRYLVPFIILICTAGFIWINKEQRTINRKKYFNKTQEFAFQSANYESKRSEKELLISTIQSDIVRENVIQLYVSDISVFGSVYTRDIGAPEGWNDLSPVKTSNYLNKWIDIKIDSVGLGDLKWRITQHPIKLTYGFISYVDIDSLSRGDHLLQVELDTVGMKKRAREWIEDSEYNYQYMANIPFYYTK